MHVKGCSSPTVSVPLLNPSARDVVKMIKRVHVYFK